MITQTSIKEEIFTEAVSDMGGLMKSLDESQVKSSYRMVGHIKNKPL